MRKLLFVLGAIVVSTSALAQVDKKVEKELQAAHLKVMAALKKKDVKGVTNSMTDDAVMKEMGQTMNKKQFETMLTTNLGMIDIVSADVKFSKLVVKGNVATTEYVENSKVKVKNPSGKTSLMATESKYKTTFKKIGGDWKMAMSEEVGMPKMMMDGKPFDPTVPAPKKP
ncbi:MAG: nuclear transport factor 2 family protein [Chthonomonadales bacterium]